MNSQRSDVIEFHDVKAHKLENKGTGNGGGGNMPYVSKDEFKQYEKRIDTRLDAIDTSIGNMTNTLKWAVGLAVTTLVAVVIGFTTVIFNIL